jgi:hypothetical protein
MRSRHAANGSARPLNCGVMRHRSLIVLSIAVALLATWLATNLRGRSQSPADRSLEAQATINAPAAPSPVLPEPKATLEDESAVAAVPREESTEGVSTPGHDSEQRSEPIDPLTSQRARMDAAMSAAWALSPAFRSETRDRTWAETAEAELSSRIAQAAGLELTTLRIECRETVCRIDFTFPSRENMQTSGGAMATAAVNGTPGYKTGGLILLGEDGTLTYYVRLREPGELR